MIEWKSIRGYEGRYEVSNTGSIRNAITKQVRKNQLDRYGYEYISLRAIPNCTPKNHKVHRLVALAFIENPSDKPQVNHIDGNKLNNNACNLEWVTNTENIHHGRKHGLFATRENTMSKYKYVAFANGGYKAHVRKGNYAKQKYFSIKKYGKLEAEKLAALAVNNIIETDPMFQGLEAPNVVA